MAVSTACWPAGQQRDAELSTGGGQVISVLFNYSPRTMARREICTKLGVSRRLQLWRLRDRPTSSRRPDFAAHFAPASYQPVSGSSHTIG